MNRLSINFAGLLILYIFTIPSIAPSLEAAVSDSSSKTDATGLVEEMRGFSMQPAVNGRSDGSVDPREERRQSIMGQFRVFGTKCLPALSHALADPDVQMRRNAALALIQLKGTYDRAPALDTREAIPALINALKDHDSEVRSWSAQALGEIGPDAKQAVPALLILLKERDEGNRNSSCIALGDIGPAAKQALPALKEALHDPSQDVRRFARRAIIKIEP